LKFHWTVPQIFEEHSSDEIRLILQGLQKVYQEAEKASKKGHVTNVSLNDQFAKVKSALRFGGKIRRPR